MTSPDDRTKVIPMVAPRRDPRVVAYILASLGAILVAIGVGILAGLGWGLVTAGVAMVVGAVVMVDVPRPADRHASPRPVRGQVAPPARPGPPPKPVFPTAPPPAQQPAAGSTRGG